MTDCFSHVSTTKTNIPYEKITDVSVTTDCISDCCGLKTLVIQTAGAPTAEGRINFVEDVEEYRRRILSAKKGIFSGERDVGMPTALIMSEDDVKKMGPIQKLKTLKELHDLKVLNDMEYEMTVEKILNSSEFKTQKESLLMGFN
jgi:hypothetical protein